MMEYDDIVLTTTSGSKCTIHIATDSIVKTKEEQDAVLHSIGVIATRILMRKATTPDVAER